MKYCRIFLVLTSCYILPLPSSSSKLGNRILKSNSKHEALVSPEISQPGMPPLASMKLRPRVISLNLMVAGLAGLGKTTTCAQLLDAWTHTANKGNTREFTSTKAIDASRVFERYDSIANTLLRVRIIDTPGFGNQVNHRNSVKPITSYIALCRQRKFKREMSHFRSLSDYVDPTEDSLVHVCLYFISPGRFLEIDRHFMKKVQKELTIVPVIAKADTLTDDEITKYRKEIMEVLEKDRIKVYDFDGLLQVKNEGISGLFRRGRKPGETVSIISRDGNYPWGKSKAFDPNHSDLTLIRDILLSQHTEQFLHVSLSHYARYRSRRLLSRMFGNVAKYAAIFILIALQMRGGPIKVDWLENAYGYASHLFQKLQVSKHVPAMPEAKPPIVNKDTSESVTNGKGGPWSSLHELLPF